MSKQFKIKNYQSLSTSNILFKKIIINFITRFSKSRNLVINISYNIIVIIVNDLIKYVKFIFYQSIIIAK